MTDDQAPPREPPRPKNEDGADEASFSNALLALGESTDLAGALHALARILVEGAGRFAVCIKMHNQRDLVALIGAISEVLRHRRRHDDRAGLDVQVGLIGVLGVTPAIEAREVELRPLDTIDRLGQDGKRARDDVGIEREHQGAVGVH